MTTADEVAGRSPREDRERERREADRRYNDALTALDRAIVDAGAQSSLGRDDLARLGTSLLEFLQRITAFVETKDRELAAASAERFAAIERPLADLAELRTQIAVTLRAVQSLERTQHPAPSAQHPAPLASPQPPALSPRSTYQYAAFEDRFRGSSEAIAERLRVYVPLLQASARGGLVVDLGCGRGELLAALKAAGVNARGVDANPDMAAIARDAGLDAVHGDALAFLDAQPDASLGGIVATQVVEHLEPAYLTSLIETAARTLQPGGVIVLETINVACWLAFFSSYIRDLTHVRPVHPETLQFLLRAAGFTDVEIRYTAAVPEDVKMRSIDLPPAVAFGDDGAPTPMGAIAHALNVNAAILNHLIFTHLDYAAIGYRS
jgi:SAM-dependent methyltransferase